MPWLLLAAALSFGFGQLFKWSQRRGCHAPTVVAVNYLTLSSLLAAYRMAAGNAWATPASLVVGGAMGMSFALSMRLMTDALERVPVAAVLTPFRLALVLPVAASVVLWGERVTAAQLAGIGLALVAMALVTARPGAKGGAGAALTCGAVITALAVFATQGVGQICLRWVHYAGLDDARLEVLMVCGATAGAIGALAVVWQRHRPRGRDLGMGAAIGFYNLLCLAVLLTALSHIEGTRFFPVHGCLVVLLDGVSAQLWWKERLGALGRAGIVLGAVSMLLVL